MIAVGEKEDVKKVSNCPLNVNACTMSTTVESPRAGAKRKAPRESADMEVDPASGVEGRGKAAHLPPKRAAQDSAGDVRKIPVPSNRYSPLKENWMKIFNPVVENLHLQIRSV